MYNNINIKYNDKILTYMSEYKYLGQSTAKFSYLTSGSSIIFFDDSNNLIKINNHWEPNGEELTPILLNEVGLSKLRIYFPLNSLEVYDDNISYIVCVYTWMRGRKLILTEKLISKINALAADKVYYKYENSYYEYVDVTFINPNEILYSEDWQGFRDKLGLNNNNDGVLLGVTIYPVSSVSDKYYIKNNCTEGQNSFLLNNSEQYLNLQLKHTLFDKDDKCALICNLKYNDYFQSGLDYLRIIYNIENPTLKYEVVIKDYINSTPIKILNKQVNEDSAEFEISDLYLNEFDESGDKIDYTNGLSIISSVTVLDKDNLEVLYVLSNEIPITQDIIGYFIQKPIKYIDLTQIDMNVFNLNVVNKTINNIVKLNTPEDSKSNIIQPVFFRVNDIANIVIHPEVTENICINLDSYKSKVKSFYIKVENVSFTEIGRTNSGVIFKIVGSQLPQSKLEGVYYICDQDSNVVVTSKYKYDY